MYKQQYENGIEEWNEGLLIEPNYIYMYMNLGMYRNEREK